MKSICSFLCLIIASSLGAVDLGSWYAGNGTHAYPDATCPTDWDAASGKNIVWKTHLPNWSNGSPLLVDGKLFVMSEPLDYAPILTCIDAKTGAKLWEQVLDPIEEFPKGEQAELRKLAQEGWEWNRQMHRLANQVYNYAGEQFGKKMNKTHCPRLTPDEVQQTLAHFGKERWDALGLTFPGIVRRAAGRSLNFPLKNKKGPEASRVERLRDLGLGWEYWAFCGAWTGNTYATPCSDGERIFVATGNLLFACFDLNGKRLWQVKMPWPNRAEENAVLKGQWKDRVTGAKNSWPFSGRGLVATSPVCVDGRFISCHGSWVRCFDAETGKLVWDMPMRSGIHHSCMTPGVVVLDGEAFVIIPNCAGRVGPAGEDIIRVRDGTICGLLPADSCGTGPLIAGDMVVSQVVEGRKRYPAAFKLSYDADKDAVTAVQVWRNSETFSLYRGIIADGKILAGGKGKGSLDLATGAKGKEFKTCRGGYWQMATVIGKHYLAGNGHGKFILSDIASGKMIRELSLPTHNPEVYDQARVQGDDCGEQSQWARLGAAIPLAHQGRLYIRSFDYLWCIGQ